MIQGIIDGDTVVFEKVCTVTGKQYRITVDRKRYDRWVQGGLIQDVFPDLDNSQRELLLSGTTPDEWEETFGGWE